MKDFEPMALQQCKDKVAKNHSFIDWGHLMKAHSGRLYEFIDMAAELYASQFRDRLKELEAENIVLKEVIKAMVETFEETTEVKTPRKSFKERLNEELAKESASKQSREANKTE